MSSRIESEFPNPLAEFFEQENQEEEVRRRRRAYRPRIRNRYYYAKRPTRFRPPQAFRWPFIKPFPPPRPRPPFAFPGAFPFSIPVQPLQQPSGPGAPPPGFAPSGGAAPDSWDPQGAVVEPSPDVNGQGAEPGAEPGDGDMAQPTDAQPTGGDEEFFEFGSYEGEAPAPRKKRTINLGEVVICGGTPFAKLDNFVFGKWNLRKDAVRDHPGQVDAIAREIINRARRGRQVPTVCIVGHTDYIGRLDSNYELGLRRARSVKDALCKRLGKYANNLTYVVNSLGETDPSPRGTTSRARDLNRRVDVHLLSERLNGETCNGRPGGGGSDERCGVPRRSPRRELEMAQEMEQFEKTSPAKRVRVRPKLSLYLLATDSSERNHFHHQAQGTARRIGAIEKPNASSCSLRVGPTPFGTGADIINSIRAAWECVGKKPIETVHIFGHSSHTGIAGNTPGRGGIRQDSLPIDRAEGGRHISEIPTDVLSNNVIFVLHGCRQAEGCDVKGDDDNFAQSLYQHLKGKLSNPQVYGHYNRGCAGRNNSWCLYSKTHPKGKARVGPSYTDPGGCAKPAKPSREFEVEMEEESGPCDTIQTFTVDDYGRGVSQLSSSQQAKIDEIKKAIRKRARNCGGISIVEIRGHSSTEGPAGRNKDLGQRRANVVKDALGPTIFRARAVATSKGEEQPLITPDNTDQKQRKNRRVEIFVM